MKNMAKDRHLSVRCINVESTTTTNKQSDDQLITNAGIRVVPATYEPRNGFKERAEGIMAEMNLEEEDEFIRRSNTEGTPLLKDGSRPTTRG